MGANATDPSEDPVDRFRARLLRVIDRSGVSRSAFARKVGIDRSTLSQILSPASRRLPRVDTLVAIARNETVSIDWLVGLSQEGAYAPEILERDVELQPGGRSPSDERLAQWHREAHGYKIRYVPTTLPDLLRTDAVTDFEFAPAGTGVAELRRDANRERLALQRRPETDMEACSSLQGIELFARGQGIWSGLPGATRREQLRRMISLCEELYPRFRWFWFDGLQWFCVPLTVFGPLRAVIYVGGMFMVLNGREHIRALTDHFDALIRAAVVQPNEIPRELERLVRLV